MHEDWRMHAAHIYYKFVLVDDVSIDSFYNRYQALATRDSYAYP